MINITKLSQELVFAGITTHGNCNSSGIVWDDDNNEIQDRPDVAAIIAAHDPTEYSISPSEIVIIADGIDVATFQIKANPEDETTEVLVGDAVTVVQLDDAPGVGTLEISTNTPGIILVQGNAGGLSQCQAKAFAGGLS